MGQNKTQGTDNTSSYLYVKRQRRRTSSLERPRSISVTVTTFDYSSSGDETIYSAQGYETAAIGDMEDLASEDDFEEGNIDEEAKENIRARAAAAAADAVPAEAPESNDSSDNVFEIDNVYQVEYEPESEIDTEIDEPDKNGRRKNKSARFSDSDTDLEDVIIFAATLFELADDTDLAEWADSSDTVASDSGIETPGVISKEGSNLAHIDQEKNKYDAESTSVRTCISCNKPDIHLHPLMRECHSCWQNRRGQKPDRPKPRRRKNKGKGKNSFSTSLKTTAHQVPSSSAQISAMSTLNYNSDHSTSTTNTSEVSSQ